jgi:hypothetical protein
LAPVAVFLAAEVVFFAADFTVFFAPVAVFLAAEVVFFAADFAVLVVEVAAFFTAVPIGMFHSLGQIMLGLSMAGRH